MLHIINGIRLKNKLLVLFLFLAEKKFYFIMAILVKIDFKIRYISLFIYFG